MNSQRILLAGDDRVVIEILARRCQRLGLVTLSVHTGDQVPKAFERFRPQLVCIDGQLQDSSGNAVCEQLAANPSTSHLPMIILADAATDLACYGLSAHYVPKAANLWKRVEPLVCAFFDIEPPCPAVAVAADFLLAEEISAASNAN